MRVLVVEDEHKIARALKKALEQDHYAVDVRHNGDDGCAMATTEPYDIMILDRMIPGEYDGIGIIKEVRAQQINTPIILLTALGRTNDKTDGLDAGADDYVVKPYALEELLARVRALLRRPAVTMQNVLSAGDLLLDLSERKVSRAGVTIELTAKEFSLLEFLMRNKNKPVSKDSIIQHVWDYDADILPNTVEVYIKYLRNKIDRPFSSSTSDLIQTVRGFGYKLKDDS